MAVVHRHYAAGFLYSAYFLKALLIAEAVVSLALFYELLGVLLEHTHSFRLDVRAYGAADIRAFVPVKTYVAQGVVYYLRSALYKALTVGVLYSEDKISAAPFRYKVSEKCSS